MKGVALVTLAACWTSTAPPPVEPTPPPQVAMRRTGSLRSPCDATVSHLLEIEHDELAGIPDYEDKLDAIRDAATASCIEMKWSDELIQCFAGTVDNSALRQCESLVTPDQGNDLMRRITEIVTGSNQPPPLGP